MSYTVKELRAILADLPEDELVTGIIYTRKEQYITMDDDTERAVTPEEWPGVVWRFEDYVGDEGLEGLWSCMSDALGEETMNDD